MWLADALRRFVILYLKFLFALAGLCVLAGYSQVWWRSVHLTVSGAFLFLMLGAVSSTAAYLIRERRRPRAVPHAVGRATCRDDLYPP